MPRTENSHSAGKTIFAPLYDGARLTLRDASIFALFLDFFFVFFFIYLSLRSGRFRIFIFGAVSLERRRCEINAMPFRTAVQIENGNFCIAVENFRSESMNSVFVRDFLPRCGDGEFF